MFISVYCRYTRKSPSRHIIYSTEYAYLVAFVKTVTKDSYDQLVDRILQFRAFDDEQKISLLKADEHTYVNRIYEWQYYTQKLLSTVGIIAVALLETTAEFKALSVSVKSQLRRTAKLYPEFAE